MATFLVVGGERVEDNEAAGQNRRVLARGACREAPLVVKYTPN